MGNRTTLRREINGAAERNILLKRKWLILFLLLLVIAVAAMIFFFSAQDGSESMDTSGKFVNFVMRLVFPGFEAMSPAEKLALYERLQLLIRKAAHFTEFFMLGASVRLLFHALRLRRASLWAWTAATLYACTDEWHQMFVGARAASWKDVALDSSGVLAGVLAAAFFLMMRRKKHKERFPVL